MTIVTRDQMRPGQIVARVTRQHYRVRPEKWADNAGGHRAGTHKVTELDRPETTWELVRDRVKVWSTWDWEWPARWLVGDYTPDPMPASFRTFAEAIAYADKQARRP